MVLATDLRSTTKVRMDFHSLRMGRRDLERLRRLPGETYEGLCRVTRQTLNFSKGPDDKPQRLRVPPPEHLQFVPWSEMARNPEAGPQASGDISKIFPKRSRFWRAYMVFYDYLRNSYEYRRMLQSAQAALVLPREATCLDIGCGTGNSTAMMTGQARKVIGVDSSLDALLRARRKYPREIPNLTLHWSDAPHYLACLPSNSVDRVLAINVLYAMQNAEAVLQQIYRVLRPGGIFVFSDPRPDIRPTEVLKANLRWRWRENSWGSAVKLVAQDVLMAVPLLAFNVVITYRARSSSYVFLYPRQHREALARVGFQLRTISTVYAGQNSLFAVEKPIEESPPPLDAA